MVDIQPDHPDAGHIVGHGSPATAATQRVEFVQAVESGEIDVTLLVFFQFADQLVDFGLRILGVGRESDQAARSRIVAENAAPAGGPELPAAIDQYGMKGGPIFCPGAGGDAKRAFRPGRQKIQPSVRRHPEGVAGAQSQFANVLSAQGILDGRIGQKNGKLFPDAVHQVQSAGSGHPEIAVGPFEHRQHAIGGKCGTVFRVVSVVDEAVAVVLDQPVPGGEPDETLAIFVDVEDVTLRQTVLQRNAVEVEGLRLRIARQGEACQQQAEE